MSIPVVRRAATAVKRGAQRRRSAPQPTPNLLDRMDNLAQLIRGLGTMIDQLPPKRRIDDHDALIAGVKQTMLIDQQLLDLLKGGKRPRS